MWLYDELLCERLILDYYGLGIFLFRKLLFIEINGINCYYFHASIDHIFISLTCNFAWMCERWASLGVWNDGGLNYMKNEGLIEKKKIVFPSKSSRFDKKDKISACGNN